MLQLILSLELQKQPFVDVLRNRCSAKLRNFLRKTPVLGSLFNKLAGPKAWRSATLLKRDFNSDIFVWILRNSEEQLFYRTPPVVASGMSVEVGCHINQKRDKNTSKRLMLIHVRTFFKSKRFISKVRLKLVKNQANAKQHPEAELLLLKLFTFFISSTFSTKNNTTYSKKIKEQVWLWINWMRLYDKSDQSRI